MENRLSFQVMWTAENADRSQSELFIVDTNGDNFKMLVGRW
jgi:hypothetical protein